MFENLNDIELKAKVNYLNEGIHNVKITKLESSEKTNPKAKTPYIEFSMEDKAGGATRTRMYGNTNDTKSEAKLYKAKRLKEFLVAAGVTDFTVGNNKACMDAVGKEIEVCLITREYWLEENGQPTIKKTTDMFFANKKGTGKVFDAKWNRPLDGDDLRAYTNALEFAGTTSVNESSAVNDMPF